MKKSYMRPVEGQLTVTLDDGHSWAAKDSDLKDYGLVKGSENYKTMQEVIAIAWANIAKEEGDNDLRMGATLELTRILDHALYTTDLGDNPTAFTEAQLATGKLLELILAGIKATSAVE